MLVQLSFVPWAVISQPGPESACGKIWRLQYLPPHYKLPADIMSLWNSNGCGQPGGELCHFSGVQEGHVKKKLVAAAAGLRDFSLFVLVSSCISLILGFFPLCFPRLYHFSFFSHLSLFSVINFVALNAFCLSIIMLRLFFSFLHFLLCWILIHFKVVVALQARHLSSSLIAEVPAQGFNTHKSQTSGNRQCPLLTMLQPHLLIQGEAVAVTDFFNC